MGVKPVSDAAEKGSYSQEVQCLIRFECLDPYSLTDRPPTVAPMRDHHTVEWIAVMERKGCVDLEVLLPHERSRLKLIFDQHLFGNEYAKWLRQFQFSDVDLDRHLPRLAMLK